MTPVLTFDGPPAPVPPEVISRDAVGRATVRAVRVPAAIRIDGQLDEAVYASLPSMSDFIQNDPQEGAPAIGEDRSLDSVRPRATST